MDDITIRYWSPHGRQEETKFHSGHSKIDLVMRAAKKVDLTNLQECNRLEFLDLSNNMLESLDLTPLINCSTLKEINLRNNHLTKIDIWPLLDCSSLDSLDLSENRLQGVDLTPVFLKSKVKMDSSTVIKANHMFRYVFTLKELSERFHLMRPDGAPWSAVPVIIWTTHKELSRDTDWNLMRQQMAKLIHSLPKERWFGFQRGLLESLDMGELSGYDGNPINLIDSTESSMSYGTARSTIYDRTLELLEDQLSNNGPTLFLDIERMKNTRASKLIPMIVGSRREEIEKTTLQIKGSKVFLRPLWLTHYGFTILQAMGNDLTTNSDGLDILKQRFSEIDLSLATKEVKVVTPSYSGNASHSLQRYVFNVVKGLYD